MKKQRRLGLTIVLMGAVSVVCLPIILPVVAVLQILHYRRMRAAARKFACLSCGSYLGSEAIRLADEAWQRYFSDKRAHNPDVRFRTGIPRIVRQFRAICPHCGARYDFVVGEKTSSRSVMTAGETRLPRTEKLMRPVRVIVGYATSPRACSARSSYHSSAAYVASRFV
jgi:hypothetical protein